MSKSQYGVAAVGNALVDVLSQTSEEFLAQQKEKYGMEKGAMTLIDENRADELYEQTGPGTESSGGSAGNTMAGFASFGGKGAFIGKVGTDELGKVFKHDLISMGIDFTTQPLMEGEGTGRCLILVSEDAERTMNTYLGAAVELTKEDIEEDIIGNADVTYLEGYLFDRDQAKQAFIRAAELAHKNGKRIALTLSDPFCVDRHRTDFLHLVDNHVDILFANEDEIKSLYQKNNFEDAIKEVSAHVEIAAITRSEKGCVIISKEGKIEVPADPVEQVIDTTGAGDQFAAGFLYGFTEGMDLKRCAELGCIAAAEIITHYGGRPLVKLADLAA